LREEVTEAVGEALSLFDKWPEPPAPGHEGRLLEEEGT
jgi:hypothetical protein